MIRNLLEATAYAALTYYIALNGLYLLLTAIASRAIARHRRARAYAGEAEAFASPLTPPVSMLLPAYNERAGIVESVKSLLALRYPEHEVIKASDGAEALEAIRDRLPDIAILDVMMPKLTGYEITEQLRADESTKRIPVILLTARVQEADVARGFESGADDYIKKPFSPGELQLRVQAILGRA